MASSQAGDIQATIAQQRVHSVYQPIVDLSDNSVVGYEALARGPAGTELESPTALFRHAAEARLTGELDRLCRERAIEGALGGSLVPPLSLFMNIEPSTLRSSDPLLTHLPEIGAGRLRVIAEFTERALASRPAEAVAAVQWLRRRGCGIALDDVGTDPRSLALLPFLSPTWSSSTCRSSRNAVRRARWLIRDGGRRRGRAPRHGGARRGSRDRGAPPAGAGDGRDARPGLAVRQTGRAAGADAAAAADGDPVPRQARRHREDPPFIASPASESRAAATSACCSLSHVSSRPRPRRWARRPWSCRPFRTCASSPRRAASANRRPVPGNRRR